MIIHGLIRPLQDVQASKFLEESGNEVMLLIEFGIETTFTVAAICFLQFNG